MIHKIAFVNAHTHDSNYLKDVYGKDYEFESFEEAQKQLDCFDKEMHNGKFVIVEQYYTTKEF